MKLQLFRNRVGLLLSKNAKCKRAKFLKPLNPFILTLQPKRKRDSFSYVQATVDRKHFNRFVCTWNLGVYQFIKHLFNESVILSYTGHTVFWFANDCVREGSTSCQDVFDQLANVEVLNANKRVKMFTVACKRLYFVLVIN